LHGMHRAPFHSRLNKGLTESWPSIQHLDSTSLPPREKRLADLTSHDPPPTCFERRKLEMAAIPSIPITFDRRHHQFVPCVSRRLIKSFYQEDYRLEPPPAPSIPDMIALKSLSAVSCTRKVRKTKLNRKKRRGGRKSQARCSKLSSNSKEEGTN